MSSQKRTVDELGEIIDSRRSITRSVSRKLTKTFKDADVCSICLECVTQEGYEMGKVMWCDNLHMVHSECLDQYVSKAHRVRCPTCITGTFRDQDTPAFFVSLICEIKYRVIELVNDSASDWDMPLELTVQKSNDFITTLREMMTIAHKTTWHVVKERVASVLDMLIVMCIRTGRRNFLWIMQHSYYDPDGTPVMPERQSSDSRLEANVQLLPGRCTLLDSLVEWRGRSMELGHLLNESEEIYRMLGSYSYQNTVATPETVYKALEMIRNVSWQEYMAETTCFTTSLAKEPTDAMDYLLFCYKIVGFESNTILMSLVRDRLTDTNAATNDPEMEGFLCVDGGSLTDAMIWAVHNVDVFHESVNCIIAEVISLVWSRMSDASETFMYVRDVGARKNEFCRMIKTTLLITVENAISSGHIGYFGPAVIFLCVKAVSYALLRASKNDNDDDEHCDLDSDEDGTAKNFAPKAARMLLDVLEPSFEKVHSMLAPLAAATQENSHDTQIQRRSQAMILLMITKSIMDQACEEDFFKEEDGEEENMNQDPSSS